VTARILYTIHYFQVLQICFKFIYPLNIAIFFILFKGFTGFCRNLLAKYYHVIFHFLLRNSYNELFNLDPPLKSTAPFGAKIAQVNSTLETAPPPLFLDPVSQSGPVNILYFLRMLLM
jgi:hypothetical protein